MVIRPPEIQWQSEAALCQAFRLRVPQEWVVYPETCGWDMLLVHRVGGWQIGVEAKLTLNAKVICQALERRHHIEEVGPDFRAVLVGKVVAENAEIARALGITVIHLFQPAPRQSDMSNYGKQWRVQGPRIPEFTPHLPDGEHLARIGDWWSIWDDVAWFDRFPSQRHKLPDYVPEVAAGVPSPLVLSDWKIKAMRVCVWVEKNQVITRSHFKRLGIDPSRWMTGVWLKAGAARGEWVAGPRFPADQLRREHGSIYSKVEADYPEWSKKVVA